MRRLAVDAVLILLLAGAGLVWSDALPMPDDWADKQILAYGSTDAWRTHLLWWFLAGVPAAVAIVLRHRRPLTAMVLAVGSAGFYLIDGGFTVAPMAFAVLVTLYTLAGSAHPRRTVLIVLVVTEAMLFAASLAVQAGLVAGGGFHRDKVAGSESARLAKSIYAIAYGDAPAAVLDAVKGAAVPALLLAATWAIADGARTRRAHLAALQAKAEVLEREQQQRTALAVAAERSRIARELHDVVAHGLSVMVVQAQGAKVMLTRQPDRTDTALTTIVTTGRASLAEMRRLLGLARAEPHADLAPQPNLAALPALVDRVRDSGRPVDFRLGGEPATLPTVIELAAYRIVQEALTNVLKHGAPGGGSTVTLEFRPDTLAIRVADDGEPLPPSAPGNGLRGIAERVHALGGRFRAAPLAAGGFEVVAELPIAPFPAALSPPALPVDAGSVP